MLRGIRKASSNWLGRIVMGVVLGLIAVSFAVWGIGDIFRGFGRSTVAKIGSTEITVEQFRQIYNDKLQQLSRQIGRPVTQEQARRMRLDEQLADQLVAENTIDQRTRQMRLNLSNEEVARQIMADPTFKGSSGQFERARFEAIIRNAGYNEPRFAAEQKKLTLRRELVETVSGSLSPPKTLEQAYNRYENEQRAIDYVTLDRTRAGDIAPPTADQIQSYFDGQKAQFRAPEYRSIVVMALTPAELARPDEVSDADAKRYYDANLARYGTPERRQLEQIVFPTLEEAQAAAARLGESLSFEALAKERGHGSKGPRYRLADQVRDLRPRHRGRFICAAGRRCERADQGDVRRRADQGGEDRARPDQEVRGGRPRDQADARNRARAQGAFDASR